LFQWRRKMLQLNPGFQVLRGSMTGTVAEVAGAEAASQEENIEEKGDE
jgi:hypothetical protein